MNLDEFVESLVAEEDEDEETAPEPEKENYELSTPMDQIPGRLAALGKYLASVPLNPNYGWEDESADAPLTPDTTSEITRRRSE